jgi:hypothetical protein
MTKVDIIKLRDVELLTERINKGIFSGKDIENLLAKLREYTNSSKFKKHAEDCSDKVFAEAYEYLLNVMHGTSYAHSSRNQGPMYDWIMGSINWMQSFRGENTEKISNRERLNNFVVDRRIVRWLWVVVQSFLVADGNSCIRADEEKFKEYANDILLCVLCILQVNRLSISDNKGYISMYLIGMLDLSPYNPIKGETIQLMGDIILEKKINNIPRMTSLTVSKTYVPCGHKFVCKLQKNPAYPSLSVAREISGETDILYERSYYKAIRNNRGELFLKVVS